MNVQFLDVLIGNVLVGRLSKMGDMVQFLGEESYFANPNRPTISLSYNSLHPTQGDKITREIMGTKGTVWTRAIRGVPAFFHNLLPEGALLDWIAAKRGVSTDNHFELLAATGDDLPGALRIRPTDPNTAASLGIDGNQDLDSVIDTAAPMEGAFSLAGQQMKLAVSIIEKGKRYTLRTKGICGQEIIAKLPSFQRGDIVQNEFAGMRLAELAGVEVAPYWMESTEALDVKEIDKLCPQGQFLAVERFDRPIDGPAVHTEDWCQVNGRRPMEKYAQEKPYIKALQAIHAYSPNRFVDAEQFFRRQVANVLMGNSDAHLKNFSFIYPDGRFPRLSKAYDMVPIIAYLGTGQYILNEKIEGAYQKLTIEDFVAVGRAAGFAPRATARTVRDTIELIQEAWPKTLPDLPICEVLSKQILNRIDQITLVKSAFK